MWTVVYVTSSTKVAEEIRDLLQREGLLVRLRNCRCNPDESTLVEILVPDAEAGEAVELLQAPV